MAAGKGIVIQISGDGESAKAALELVREQLAETAEKAKEYGSEIGEAMERVKNTLETVGLYLGIREAIDAMKELMGGSLELGETLEKASQKTGLAVETLSTLHYAAAITGSDFDGLTSAVAKMDKAIGAATAGNKPAQAFLKSLGLDAKDLAGRSDGAEIAFKRFATTLAATENPIRRVQLAAGLLGKAGAEQIPMLIEVGEHWEEFQAKAKASGDYLTEDQAKALEATTQRLHDLGESVKGAGLTFMEALTPALNGMLDTIASGKSTMDTLTDWGHDVGRMLAFVAEVAYSTGAAMESLFAVAEGDEITEASRKDFDAAARMLDQAQKFHDIAFDPAPEGKLLSEKKSDHYAQKGAGFGGVGDPTPKTPKSDDGFLRAYTELAQEQTKAQTDAQKQTTSAMLAELESQHKQMLVGDQEFLEEKLRLQVEGFEAEKAGLEKQLAELQALEEKQHRDKTLKRDKSGNSVEELKTQKDLLGIQQKIGEVTAKSQAAGSANTAENFAQGQARDLASLEMAAKLEQERSNGLVDQIALIQRRTQLEEQKVKSAGGSDVDVATVSALGRVEIAKLRIADVDRQIRDSEEDNKRAVEALNDAAEKDPRFKRAATQQINQLNKDQADNLRALVAQYDALAAQLGGPFLQTAKNLHAELDSLSRPTNKGDAQMGKELASGVEEMATRLATATQSGKDSFHKMALSIEQDVLRLAVKIAMQKWLTPLLTGIGAGAGGGGNASGGMDLGQVLGLDPIPGHADGGDYAAGPMIVGEQGPELMFPSGPGSITPNNVLSDLADRGGGGSAPNVAFNVTNASSQPVTARQTGSSFDSDTRQYITHVILEDQASGGPISQSMRQN